MVAAGLRLWSIDHGLPYSYNLDERAHFVPHAVAMTGGDLNPGYFINPPLLTYLLAAYLSVIHLGGVEDWFANDPTAVFTAARMVSVVFGVATVAATYAAGRAWFGRTAGLVAAAIMAVAFMPVFYSRLALNDGPGVLPCALALWCSALVLKTGSRNALLAGGAAVGAAASFKYSDGAIVIALVAAAFLSPRADLQAGAEVPDVRGADRARVRDRHEPVPVRRTGACSPTTSTASASSPPARRCSASPSATAGSTTSPARAGRWASCPACWRSRAASRCWSRASAARRSCSAR